MPLCLLTPASQHASLNGRCPPSDLWLFDLWLGHSESGGHIIPIHPLFEVQLVFFLTFWEVLWPFFLKFFFFFLTFWGLLCKKNKYPHLCGAEMCFCQKFHVAQTVWVWDLPCVFLCQVESHPPTPWPSWALCPWPQGPTSTCSSPQGFSSTAPSFLCVTCFLCNSR